MDVAPTFERSSTFFRTAARQVRFGLGQALSLSIFASFSGILNAQTNIFPQVVHVAMEPALADSPTHASRKPTQRASMLHRGPTVDANDGEPSRILQPKEDEIVSKSEASTQRGLNFLPAQRPIGQVSIDLRSKPKGGSNIVPENLAQKAQGEIPLVKAASAAEMLGNTAIEQRRNHDELFAYQPLYFEEVNLERYGRTCGPLQPTISGARFFATIASLPYAMAVHHPNQTYLTKWPSEAGWGAPKVRELQPLQWKPGIVQAGVVTGLIFVVP